MEKYFSVILQSTLCAYDKEYSDSNFVYIAP